MHLNTVFDNSYILLRKSEFKYGLKASLDNSDNYSAFFTQDTITNALGLEMSNDFSLVAPLVRQLRYLKLLQDEFGQIPSNFLVQSDKSLELSFGSLTSKFDGVCWYIIAVMKMVNLGKLEFHDFENSIVKGFACLETLEFNGKGLIYSPVGGDWADEYILSGYVLHIQVLRLWALKLYFEYTNDEVSKQKFFEIKEKVEFQFVKKEAQTAYLISGFSPVKKFEFFD